MPDERQEQTYEQWMAELERRVQARFGLRYADLPDLLLTHDAWAAGTSVASFMEEELLPVMREEFGDEAVDATDGEDE